MAWTELIDGYWTPKRVSQSTLVVKWSEEPEHLPSLANFIFSAKVEKTDLRIHVGRWKATDNTSNAFYTVGHFDIHGERIAASESNSNGPLQGKTLSTKFQRYSWHDVGREVETIQELKASIPPEDIAHSGDQSPSPPLLGIPPPRITRGSKVKVLPRQLTWTLSYGNNTLSAVTGLVVEEHVDGDISTGKSILVYPIEEITDYSLTPSVFADLDDSSIREVEDIEHECSEYLMQTIYQQNGVQDLFNDREKISVWGFGKAVVEENKSEIGRAHV